MIDIPIAIKISLRALRTNKMRSALTMLGIIIGVCAVIAMLSIGTGASRKVSAQLESLGSNMLIVLPGATTAGGVRFGLESRQSLTIDDANAIKEEAPAVLDVAPEQGGVTQVVYGNQNWPSSIVGTTPGYLVVRDWPVLYGRALTESDVRAASSVCVLGLNVVENLFGDVNPVGHTVRIKKVPFKVIGVLSRKGQAAGGREQDDTVVVPVTTAQKKLFGTTFPGMVRRIYVKAKSREDLYAAQSQITDILRQRHHIGARQEDDFSVRNLAEMIQAAEATLSVMTYLLGAIASISLIVGGIGIMNIMLVSVTERTREIGIRMSVGAKTWDIRLQFIIEALTLSLIGGIIGIAVGIAAAKLVSALAGWSTVVTPFSIILAFGFSGAVGLFFGFYPAYKASLLNPIDALRYE